MARPDTPPTLPAESRGASGHFGKLNAEIKLRIDDDTKDLLEKKANRLGLTLGEYLRERCYVDVYGIDHMRKVAAARIDMVAGIGDES